VRGEDARLWIGWIGLVLGSRSEVRELALERDLVDVSLRLRIGPNLDGRFLGPEAGKALDGGNVHVSGESLRRVISVAGENALRLRDLC